MFPCDRCRKPIDMKALKGDPTHSNSVCTDETPGFKEFDHYCDECYALPEVRNQEPHYNLELARAVDSDHSCETLW
jgi:hypothetical protein